MNNIAESWLNAMFTIANKTVDEISSDKTIKAIVKKIVSTSEGKYLISCDGGENFYAYTQPGSTEIYQVDEQIYILVPQGDMSQRKFILGKVEDNKQNLSFKVPTNSLLNDFTMIGNNIVIENTYRSGENLFVKRMQPLSLNSSKGNDFYCCYLKDTSEIEDNYNTYDQPSISIDEETFLNSAKQSEALLLRAKFKADINTKVIGNYGIIVNIAFADETNPQTNDLGETIYPPKLIAYVLDTSKMTGNPMNFYDYVSQYTIAPFDGEKYLYIDSIIAFSEGFPEQEIKLEDDIYIDGFEIIGLKEISAVNGDYKLRLTTPSGNTIKEGRKDDLKIVATTTYLNQNISKDTVFYWGVKDPSITPLSENYNAKLGPGYRYLEVENKDELILTAAELTAAENIFICTAVYESDIILKTSISMYNNNNKLNITIESDQGTDFQFNEGNPTLTCLINGKTSNYQENYPDAAFSFIWSKEDADFGTILLNETETQLEASKQRELDECAANTNTHTSEAGRTVMEVISYYSTRAIQVQNVSYPNGIYGSKINCKLKNTNNYAIYSCSVYRAGIYVGYSSITLQNSKKVINNNYYITITNGNQVFQYDEFGVAPNSVKKQEPIEVLDLIATFYSPQGVEVTPKNIRWVVPRGKTLINIPSLGLQTDLNTGERYYFGNIFPLAIKDTYDNTCNDNQIIVIATHADGTEYRQSTNLLFTKVGEIGTNGTETVIKINEAVNVPTDECLTIIKPANEEAFYNTGNSDDDPILEANLYTNNTQVLGHTTKWTIAGTSGTQAYNYQVETENDNHNCIVKYNGNENSLDTRIVEARTSLNGKYFYSFYSIPAIEYQTDYDYENYPIKILRDGTLKTVLYDSNGMNPSYDINKGVHVELLDWPETGYLEWTVESGAQEDGIYKNPNLLLSKNSRAKAGSRELKIGDSINSIQSTILEIQDMTKACANNSIGDIKDYINNFLVDIKRISADNLLSTQSKLDLFWNRLATFKKDTVDETNIYINTVSEKYSELFKTIEEEYQLCKNINKEYSDIYNNVQNIWSSEWPNVIFGSRLHLIDGQDINNIEELIQKYQDAYNDRSNDEIDAAEIPERTIFDDDFEIIIGHRRNNNDGSNSLDKYYDNYLASSNNQDVQLQSILIEYAKVLMTYINILVKETQDYFNGIENESIKSEIIDKYSFAYSDWSSEYNKSNYDSNDNNDDPMTDHMIGRNIYEIVSSAEENIANVYDNIRKLYQYYQMLYLNVKKYQITEESEILNVWNAISNGQKPELLDYIYVIPNNSFNGLYMNNNIVGTAFVKENNEKVEVAKIYIPIIMTLNTYELAALNGWDGTSIEIGDDHIMTPQIGAGIKDETTNTFTGMVMGVLNNPTSDRDSRLNKADKVGLMGYLNGKQSVFIDSKTGRATFGLPEDDNNQTDEGRIELIPGGVSKIGNWKIGNRFLYNIVDGSYEKRKDIDDKQNKMMVPHDKHGIILSSDQPYIHVKGEVYEDINLANIDYTDEYNNINPGDSLELRMDPSNKSLFSIIQHTSGFGDEDIEDLLFGYKSSGSDTITVVKNYVPNQNIDEEIQIGNYANETSVEYYIYRLATDNNGDYIPYYKEDNNYSISKINGDSWKNQDIVINNNTLLNTALSWEHFRKTGSSNPVFSIDNNTGIISYNPDNLIWNNNNENWQSITEKVSSLDDLNVVLRYTERIDTPFEKDIVFGQIKNNSGNELYKLKIKNCSLFKELINITFDDPINSYIQFYLVSNENNELDKALLISEEINILNNENLDIELFSFNERKLFDNQNYWLKAYIYIDSYTINADCYCPIEKEISIYKTPPSPPFGTIKITEITESNNWEEFTTSEGFASRISGKYKVYAIEESTWRLEFEVYGTQKDNDNPNNEIPDTQFLTYDFIVWLQEDEEIIAGGRSFSDYSVKICTTTFTELNNLNGYIDLNMAPSENNPLCISFYLLGSYTEEKDTYFTDSIYIYQDGSQNTQWTEQPSYFNTMTMTETGNSNIFNVNVTETSEVLIENDADTVNNIVTENTTNIVQYKLINNTIASMENRELYNINWDKLHEIYYNIMSSWTFSFNQFVFGDIYGFIPNVNSLNRLCIQNDNNLINLQGIPYARTYWKNGIQKVTFYKDYYLWVNSNNKKSQYGYIDINENNNLYYKYIKTLKKNTVDTWFKDVNLSLDNHEYNDFTIIGDNIQIWNKINFEVNSNDFKKALYWKEFIRVGLDQNGRLFSAGLQDKKTYSRTGKIYAFGKVPDLYGQEVRIQSNTEYKSAIKIFSQCSDSSTSKTTYITQGQNDNGSISIRTSGNNNFIELATSQFSSDENNLIPTKTTFINVSYNKGIILQTEYGKIDFNEKVSVKTDVLEFQSKTEESENFKFKYSINLDKERKARAFIQIPSYTISSSLNPLGNINDNDYEIEATNSNNNPKIQFKIGNSIKLDINSNKSTIMADSDKYLQINKETTTGSFIIKKSKITLQENSILLDNNGASIKILREQVGENSYKGSILLSSSSSSLDSSLEISNSGITIKNREFVVQANSSFNKPIIAKETITSLNTVSVGDSKNTDTENISVIKLYDTYQNDKERYIILKASQLKQLFDWFNNSRWGMGYNSTTNTLYINSINRSGQNPEGHYDTQQQKYIWEMKSFSGDYSRGYDTI